MSIYAPKSHIHWTVPQSVSFPTSPVVYTIGDWHYHFYIGSTTTFPIEKVRAFYLNTGLSCSLQTMHAHAGRSGDDYIMLAVVGDMSSGVRDDYCSFYPHIASDSMDDWVLDFGAKAVLLAHWYPEVSIAAFDSAHNPFDWVERRVCEREHGKQNWKCEIQGCLEMGYLIRPDEERVLCASCLFEFIKGDKRIVGYNDWVSGRALYDWAVKRLDLREPYIPNPFPDEHHTRSMTVEHENLAFARMVEFARQDPWFTETKDFVPAVTERELRIRQFCDFPMEGK